MTKIHGVRWLGPNEHDEFIVTLVEGSISGPTRTIGKDKPFDIFIDNDNRDKRVLKVYDRNTFGTKVIVEQYYISESIDDIMRQLKITTRQVK